jgi:hypothetical protein
MYPFKDSIQLLQIVGLYNRYHCYFKLVIGLINLLNYIIIIISTTL